MKLIVNDGRQVNLDGKTYAAGETIELDERAAGPLLVRRIVSESQKRPSRSRIGRGA